jgi:hypothetical protein
MAIVVIQEFEATPEEYDKVGKEIDAESNPAEGGILHAGIDLGGGRMRVIDFWESQEAFEKFAEERLGPAVGRVMGPDTSPPDPPQIQQVHDLETGPALG